MAVVRVVRLFDRPAQEEGATGSLKLRYRVWTSSASDQSPTVLSSLLLPQYGDGLLLWEPSLPNAARFRCGSRSCEPGQSPLTFVVECDFETLHEERRDEERTPLNRRPQVTSQNRDREVPWLLTRTSPPQLITNTAGDPFVPPLTTTFRDTVYNVKWWVPLPQQWMYEEQKICNSDTVLIRGIRWAPGTLLLDSVSVGDEVWEANDRAFEVEAVLLGNRVNGWTRRLLNDGLRERVNGNAAMIRRCRDDDNQEVSAPVPLAANGSQIPRATLLANPVTAPHYLSLQEFAAVRFSSLFPPLI